MPQAAVHVEQLGKQYKIGLREASRRTLSEVLVQTLRAPLDRFRRLSEHSDGSDLIWALRDVSFDVQPGEVVGIIGPNGAGKSTLLKILARITEPTTGRAEIRGQVRSLLEVGTGFHPELSGRENIYLNGAILGMKKAEIDAHFDEIVAFAEIDRFLDTPVKRYSSGMYIRLAFAVAAHLQPEILIVDEVLAVGDVAFQQKCLGTMRDVATSGRTVLFVSHNMAAVSQLCTRAMLLVGGRIAYSGTASATVRQYLAHGQPTEAQATFAPEPRKPMQITSVAVETTAGRATSRIDYNDPCVLRVGYEIREWQPGMYVCAAVTNDAGQHILWSADIQNADELHVPRAAGVYEAHIGVPPQVLAPGRYHVSLSLYAPNTQRAFDFRERPVSFEVEDNDSLLSRFGMACPAVTTIPLTWSTQYVGPSTANDSERRTPDVACAAHSVATTG